MRKFLLGFVSPSGDFIESDEGTHGETAFELLEKLGDKQTGNGWFTEYLIYKYNYALIHMPEFGFNYVHLHYHILSDSQKAFLEKYADEQNVNFIEERVTKRMSEKGY